MKTEKRMRGFGRVASLVAAVSLFAIGAAQSAEITVWSWDKFNADVISEAAARYTAKHPDVTFNLQSLAKADIETKLLTSLASGFTDVLPDITLMEDYNAQRYIQSFPEAFVPVSETIDMKQFANYKSGALGYDGKTWGVPFDAGTVGWFYRRDYLEQAGFKPEDLNDITWDRFIEIGLQVKEKTGHQMLSTITQDGDYIRIMLQSAGGWFFDAEGKPFISGNEPLKATLEQYGKLMNSGIVKEVKGWAEYIGPINSGEVAGVIQGAWISVQIKGVPEQSGKWGVAPVPKLSLPASVNASNKGGSSWMVLDSSANKEVAVDFLNEIFAKDVDFYQKILTAPGALGTQLAAAGGPAYAVPDPFYGNQEIWKDISAWTAKIPSVSYGANTAEVIAAIDGVYPDIKAGKPIDEILSALQVQTDSRIQAQ